MAATRPRERRRHRPHSRLGAELHEYASWWLQAKVDGVIGHKPIDANTQSDYRWRLTAHLLSFFGAYPLDEIDRQLCLRFKEPSSARRRSCARRSPPARCSATATAEG